MNRQVIAKVHILFLKAIHLNISILKIYLQKRNQKKGLNKKLNKSINHNIPNKIKSFFFKDIRIALTSSQISK